MEVGFAGHYKVLRFRASKLQGRTRLRKFGTRCLVHAVWRLEILENRLLSELEESARKLLAHQSKHECTVKSILIPNECIFFST